ncbi:Neurogenic locus Notch protein, partial [Gryllus bimaculatus]
MCACAESPPDPCAPSPCRANGQCRVVNGAAVCTYPECVINADCPRDKACFAQRCRDPCPGACGLNALCSAVNHDPVCSCPPGYFGSPRVECKLQPTQQEPPRPECVENADCTNDKACLEGRCRDPCAAQPNTCGRNAECRTQLHRPLCSCLEGFTGNAHTHCFEIGCRSDSECPPEQACVNRACADPCASTRCGLNAECRADTFHRARCYCLPGHRGDPWTRCDRPQCTDDAHCPDNLACVGERCENPCVCAPNALCSVAAHRPTCRCPPGYTGNPNTLCVLAPTPPPPQCTMDADCASKLACFSGKCKNPCVETKPCTANAECIVVDTLPLRTMSCQCLPGFVGDADVECKPAPTELPGCKNDNECPDNSICLNRQCVNPCLISNPCASNAECRATNHRATCTCPAGFMGNAFINCYKPQQDQPECTSNSDCASDKACINQRCLDPCVVNSPCGTGAKCRTINHFPTCYCPDGWGGNPQVQCYKPECSVDADCVYDKACIGGNCLDPCAHGSGGGCGRGAECVAQAHRAHCVCPAGTQGDALLACVSVACQYNEDCADHEACDRLNRVCRPVCEDDTCADTAVCIAKDHQPTCVCPPGTSGNPYFECGKERTPTPPPECTRDADCPPQLACVSGACRNPCTSATCSPDQECRVLDTLPLRTVMCVCPPDTVTDASGRCRAI